MRRPDWRAAFAILAALCLCLPCPIARGDEEGGEPAADMPQIPEATPVPERPPIDESAAAPTAPDLSASPPDSTEPPAAPDNQPIAAELSQGIELLDTQIARQQELLDAAQTMREKQLIRDHIRSLEKERRSLESLLQ